MRQPKRPLDNIKCINIHIIGVPEGDEGEKAPEKISEEIIAENFSYMGKEIAKSRKHRVPGRINPRRNTQRHTVIKLTAITDRNRILKATREK